eukprot:5033135-Pleurochrysis_carterae.AAC.1
MSIDCQLCPTKMRSAGTLARHLLICACFFGFPFSTATLSAIGYELLAETLRALEASTSALWHPPILASS